MAENDMSRGDLAAARLHLQEAARIIESSGNNWLQVLVSYFQGLLSYYDNDNGEAVKLLAETVQLARHGQFMPDLARSLVSQGRAELRLGQISVAEKLIREGLKLFMDFRHKLGMVKALEALASVRTVQGNGLQAVKMIATASRLRQELGTPLPPIDQSSYDSTVAATRSQLGEPLFTELWVATETESLEDVVKEMLDAYDAD
jgi:hypothetical protein